MLLDKKGKLFGKVSIVDLLVILVVLAMALGAFLTYQKIADKAVLTENKGLIQTPAADTLEVTMRIEEVRQMTVDALVAGDEVFFTDTGKFFGTITDVSVEPAVRLIYDTKGTPVNAQVPDKFDAIIKLRVPGSRLEHGYYTQDNIRLVFDSDIPIKTPAVETTPTIENITVMPGE